MCEGNSGQCDWPVHYNCPASLVIRNFIFSDLDLEIRPGAITVINNRTVSPSHPVQLSHHNLLLEPANIPWCDTIRSLCRSQTGSGLIGQLSLSLATTRLPTLQVQRQLAVRGMIDFTTKYLWDLNNLTGYGHLNNYSQCKKIYKTIWTETGANGTTNRVPQGI